MISNSCDSDSLQFVPVEKWVDLEKVFLADWPRGVPAYNALVTQKKITKLGLDYGFKVYLPYGDMTSGIVALNRKAKFNEIIIQCPNNDTTVLEKALTVTKVIDWSETIIVPFTPEHVVLCIKRVAEKRGIKCDDSHSPHHLVLFRKENPPFENVSLPDGITFKPLSEEHIDLTDSFWVNRYDSSKWVIQLFIKANGGYGLFKNNELVTWAYVNEIGSLTHLFTIEGYRKMGLGKIIVKLICNTRLKEHKDTFAFCMHTNESVFRLFQSVGFKKLHPVKWLVLNGK